MADAGLSIPTTAAEVDGTWLAKAVAGPDGSPSTLVGYDIEPLAGVLGGLMGDLSRIRLEWQNPSPELPSTVVLKLATLREGNKAFAVQFGQYAAEVGFYRDFQPTTRVRVPRCWHAAVSEGGDQFVLLLEDVGHLDVVSPIDGLSLPRATAAVDELVKLHGRWWGDARPTPSWLPDSEPPTMRIFGAIVEAVLPSFLEATSSYLSADDHALASRFVAEYDALVPDRGVGNPLDLPHTLVHRDFHLGNMFFDGDQPVIYDWGNVATGAGFYDLIYFLVWSLTEDDCRIHAPELLQRYRDGLAAQGVEMSDEEFRNAHDQNALFCMLVMMLAAGNALESNEQTDMILEATMSRLFTYMHEHDVARVFDL